MLSTSTGPLLAVLIPSVFPSISLLPDKPVHRQLSRAPRRDSERGAFGKRGVQGNIQVESPNVSHPGLLPEILGEIGRKTPELTIEAGWPSGSALTGKSGDRFWKLAKSGFCRLIYSSGMLIYAVSATL